MKARAAEGDDAAWALAADVMMPAVTLVPNDDLRTATKHFLDNGLRQLPVVDPRGRILGFLDEREVAGVYLRVEAQAENASAGIERKRP